MRKKKNQQGNGTLDSFLRADQPTKPKVPFDQITTSVKVPKGGGGPQPTIEFVKCPFIYPKNPEIREYQYHISRTCLFYNTIVCLPTGLGKTHIASVLILNYYRWFPDGKIFFLAPTRPLVNQQRSSLASYYGLIDEDSITELKGDIPIPKRKKLYEAKRVFFMTPQTLDNDLRERRFQSSQAVLVIFDEAHRATGNYSYCNIAKALLESGTGCRIVGLSATPGNCLQKIQEVITSLRAYRLESKDDNDPDVKKYIKAKEIVTVEIQANSMMVEAERLLDGFLQRPINMLVGMEVIAGYLVKVIKRQGINQGSYFQILQGFRKNIEHYQAKLDKWEIGLVWSCLRIMKMIVDVKKALREQGYDSFHQFMLNFKDDKHEKYKKIPFRKEILQSEEFTKLEKIFGKEQSSNNHPKLLKLRELLVEFFRDHQNLQEKSKAMVFTGFKASALEIKNFLEGVKEVRPALFVGQSKTTATTSQLVEDEDSQEISIMSTVSIVQLNQKQQLATIRKFKEYEYNTLISTSIGEEGLDIGEVDLIICYDSGMSPIRMMQRMGRTGRKRSGKVYMLLMEGKEADKYEKTTKESKSLQRNIRSNSRNQQPNAGSKSKQGKLVFASKNSSMLPQGLELPVQYLDNQIVVRQKSSIKKPHKSAVKEAESQHKLSDDEPELTKSVLLDQETEEHSQSSDRILAKLDALQGDCSQFESL